MVENQKKISGLLELYYDKSKNTITKKVAKPEELIIVTNKLGEMKVYYPSTNQVSYMQTNELSSQREMIFYFANNQTDHLGLMDEGFNLVSRNYDGDYIVTVWKAPSNIKAVDQVKMVFDGSNPIYAEYTSAENQVIKKIYYSNYQDYISFRLPLRITEIGYLESGDSTIKRTIFSNVNITTSPASEFFNFKIPDDATPIKK